MKHQRPLMYRGRRNRRGWKLLRGISRPGRIVRTFAGTAGVCVVVEATRGGARVRVCCNGVDYLMAAFLRLGVAELYAIDQLAGLLENTATGIRPA